MKLFALLLFMFSSTAFAWNRVTSKMKRYHPKIDRKKGNATEEKEALTIVPIFDWDTKGLALIYNF